MSILNQAVAACKGLVFGSASLRQQCPIGLREPQSEVSVWLHGLGAARDVTSVHVMAAARPLTLGIGLEDNFHREAIRRCRASLEFRERGGERKLLGEIGLRWTESIPVGGSQLQLFQTTSCRNHCLPRAQIWARSAHHAFRSWHAEKRCGSSANPVARRDLRCVFVFYICPRPVVLVSVRHGDLTNIFPMDLIGPIGVHHFSLALHNTSAAVPLLESSRRIALSSVPADQLAVAYELGKNHRKPCFDAARIPFGTSPSAAFGLPVPRFSLRVREMEIEAVQDLGSHILFLARLVEDQQWAEGPQLFFVHGIYEARRQRRRAESAAWDSASISNRVLE